MTSQSSHHHLDARGEGSLVSGQVIIRMWVATRPNSVLN